ncbi:MAG TPA: CRISPR-associated endonuclease Cas6, partial [Candidatus Methanoperedens sp.]
KYDEIKLGEEVYEIVEKGIAVKNQEFGISDEFHSYELVTPRLALNQENYMKFYGLKNRDERHELIRKTLISNLFSMSKSLDYRVPDEIKCDIQVRARKSRLKDVNVITFIGGFCANFEIREAHPLKQGLVKSRVNKTKFHCRYGNSAQYLTILHLPSLHAEAVPHGEIFTLGTWCHYIFFYVLLFNLSLLCFEAYITTDLLGLVKLGYLQIHMKGKQKIFRLDKNRCLTEVHTSDKRQIKQSEPKNEVTYRISKSVTIPQTTQD